MRWQDDLQFYAFHFMPYLDPNQGKHDDRESFWVDYSNKNFDPEIGTQLFQRYLREMQLADELGFDAVVVNEHHNTIYSMNSVCTLTASALAQMTKRAKIGVFGVPINLVNPHRLAEEYAMLDVMSGGRLEIAIPLGTGMEYWANSINPATARERFRESVDVMIQAWTKDGPTQFDGKYFTHRYLNIWPKPVQKPHPKIAIVGSGSPETIDFAAQRNWGYASVFVPRQVQVKTFKTMRELSAKYGHEMTPDKAFLNALVYVAETDEIAEKEAIPHIQHFFTTLLRTTPQYLNPPGYVSLEQFKIRAGSANAQHGGFDWEALKKDWRVAVGSPQTVAEKIADWCEEANSSRVIVWCHLGDMPHWKVVKSMTMFAEEVMPQLKKGKAEDKSAKPSKSSKTNKSAKAKQRGRAKVGAK
jgi:alkanesulfonate monooxygenase SsuD/methylene tetrahydromethanopterin reductase-like flavin-dependent oxidoreductase (luciferase family)